MTAQTRLNQADMARAIRAARDAGATAVRFEQRLDGTLVVNATLTEVAPKGDDFPADFSQTK